MWKRSWLLCGLAILLVASMSCIFDPPEKKGDGGCDDCASLKLENQTQKWHVLNNIEYAYANRSSGYQVYEELLDDDFVFFFAPGDIGGEIPEQWYRPEELSTTQGLFLSNSGTVNGPVCRSMRLDLQYNKDTQPWVEVVPEDFPDETWYTTTVYYTFTFEMEPDLTLIAVPGAKAQFTVRDADPDPTKERWVLREFRDLAGNN